MGYKLPESAVPNDERVRVEKHENILLVYHALTNDMICKFEIPEGIGNIVSLPEKEKILSVEEEMKMYYADDETALKFLQGVRKQKPRYVYAQCERMKRIQKFYTHEQIHIGMEHCNIVNICTVMELSAYLLYRYGEETARKFLNHRTYKTYLKRANEIKEEEIHGRN